MEGVLKYKEGHVIIEYVDIIQDIKVTREIPIYSGDKEFAKEKLYANIEFISGYERNGEFYESNDELFIKDKIGKLI